MYRRQHWSKIPNVIARYQTPLYRYYLQCCTVTRYPPKIDFENFGNKARSNDYFDPNTSHVLQITLKPSYYTADGKTEGESRIEDTSPSLPSVCPVTRWLQSVLQIPRRDQTMSLIKTKRQLKKSNLLNESRTETLHVLVIIVVLKAMLNKNFPKLLLVNQKQLFVRRNYLKKLRIW